jgi:hypothetical protein
MGKNIKCPICHSRQYRIRDIAQICSKLTLYTNQKKDGLFLTKKKTVECYLPS